MEDISRELEKEIALSRPAPFKRNLKKRILIIDDFGEMKSGSWLKASMYIFCIISVVCIVATTLFFYHFSNLATENKALKQAVADKENKIHSLTEKKDLLMAKLVLSGKRPDIDSKEEPASKPGKKADSSEKMLLAKAQKPEKILKIAQPEQPQKLKKPVKKEIIKNNQDIKTLSKIPEETSMAVQNDTSIELAGLRPVEHDQIEISEKPKPEPDIDETAKEAKSVAIEKFSVKKDRNNNDLIVRFDIRNISGKSGDVTGRVFTVLKPESAFEHEWLVVPKSELKEGVPTQTRKGQPFSIAHFKPVKFKIRNQPDPNFFKKASIYVFNSDAKLIYKKQIIISETE